MDKKKLLCRYLSLVIVLFGLLWGVLWTLDQMVSECPGFATDNIFDRQAHLFYDAGHSSPADFCFVRKLSDSDNPYVISEDQNTLLYSSYFPLTHLVLKPFPWSPVGGWIYTAFGALLMLLSLLPFMSGCGKERVLQFAVVVLSWPFLFAVCTGNLIWLSVAACAVFLNWYDSDRAWKRWTAVFAISFATVLKVSPVLFGILYLKRRQWREIAGCVILTSLMALAPFAFYGGTTGFTDFLDCITRTNDGFQKFGIWSGVLIERVIRSFTLQKLEVPAAELSLTIRYPFFALGGFLLLISLLWSCGVKMLSRLLRFEVVLFITAAMMLLSGNMMEYGALYLLPVFLVWTTRPYRQGDCAMAVGWFLLFFQLQLFCPLYDGNCRNLIVHFVGFVVVAVVFVYQAVCYAKANEKVDDEG